MPMMTSQILRSVNFTKSQKPRHVENETSFSIQIIIYHFMRLLEFQNLATKLQS